MSPAAPVNSLSLAARITYAVGRSWPFVRGRGRLLRSFRRQIETAPSHLRTPLKGGRFQLEIPRHDATGLSLILFGRHDAHIGPHEQYTFDLAARLVVASGDAGKLVLDVGANLGAFAWEVLQRTAVQCVAFEPQADLAELLNRNAALNQLESRLRVRPIGLSDSAGSVGFAVSADNSGVGQIVAGNAETQIAVNRLDAEFSGEQWQTVTLAKIDVETFELEVFRGAGDLWKSNRPMLIFEVLPQQMRDRGRDPRELGAYLRAQGYVEFLAIDRVLYPVANGSHHICNVLALAPEHLRVLSQLPVSRTFRPRPTAISPIFHFEL